MNENATQEGLLVRAEPLQWAQEICKRIVDVVPLENDALLLDAEPDWAGAIYAVLVEKGVWVEAIRKQTTAERLIASSQALLA